MSILREISTPVFKVEGIPRIDISSYTLKITGLVMSEQGIDWREIMALPKCSLTSRLTSVSGWSVRADWEGVRWKDFLEILSLKPETTHATFIGYEGVYTTTISLRDLAAPRVMLVYGVAGDPLEPEYGGPLRMVIPNLYGYKSCKWLCRIDFTDLMQGGYWEDRGYSRSGIIEPGTTFDVNSKTYKEINGGEVLDF
jgi:DMSO/TMAO reductase YedYZ molybdopterin-dependent catalytic subunit